MLIGSWWRLEWYIMHSRIISQISPTFGKIPRKFPEKFGNLVQISGIQSKFREFSQDFGNLNWIFQWILRTFQWFEHYSKTLKYYWILQFTEILWNSSDSHWNSQPRLGVSELWVTYYGLSRYPNSLYTLEQLWTAWPRTSMYGFTSNIYAAYPCIGLNTNP